MSQKQTTKKKNKDDEDGGKKKDEKSNPTTLVLNVDMHCDICASKIVKCLRGSQGVESLKPEIDTGKGKLIVTENVARKMKNVDIVSSLPNKEKPKKDEKKSKDKEPPVTTAVLKVSTLCPCQGCNDRVRRTVLKTKGVSEVGIERDKGMVMVKGTMDVTALARKLSEKFKRKVEVVPPKKEKDKEKGNEKDKEKDKEKEKGKEKEKEKEKGKEKDKEKEKGKEKGKEKNKEKEKESGKEGDNNGSAKKKKKGGNGDGEGDDNYKENEEHNIVPAYGYGEYSNNYMGQYHPVSQMFSDENPNSCHIM